MKMSASRLKFLESQCQKWNNAYPVGTSVEYHPVIGDSAFRQRATVSKAQVLSGHTAVIWLDGERGCVALDACVPIAKSANAENVHAPVDPAEERQKPNE